MTFFYKDDSFYMIDFRAQTIRKKMIFILIFSSIYIGILISAPLPIIRVSVENTEAHVQTKSVQRFTELLTERLEGKFNVMFHSSASLFKDADIFRALAQGKVEIAVPGTWHFDKLVPEVGLFLLPSLYGREASVSYALMESKVGESVISSIEKNINVKVLGRFIDLGHTQIFSTHRVMYNLSDFKNKRIRVAGGTGNSLRIDSLGATPVTIAWPALPLALKENSVDALLTSYETIVSAQLHHYGITYVYEDNEYFAQYVPIASCAFWEKLPQEIQEIILDSWEQIVDEAREDAKQAQERSKAVMVASNTKIIIPRAQIIEQTRSILLKDEKAIALEIGIPSDTYTLFTSFFERIDTLNYEYIQ